MFKTFIKGFLPEKTTISMSEGLIASLLAAFATGVCVFVSSLFIPVSEFPVYVASLGAAAVLLFISPGSPFSQPWPFAMSHLICALVGVISFLLFENVVLEAAFAVGLSLALMYIFRCIHPPGGAVALSFVLAPEQVHEIGFKFVLTPVMTNVMIMLGLSLILNNLFLSRRYPNALLNVANGASTNWYLNRQLFNQNDLESALKEMHSYIDVSMTDLEKIYRLAVTHASQRRLGEVMCRDIMSREVLTFEFETELEQAWSRMQESGIKACPVVDNFQRVTGIVTVSDFLRQIDVRSHKSMVDRLRNLVKRNDGFYSNKVEVVGQIMTKSPYLAFDDQHIISLLELFSEKKIHYVPIVDQKKILVGMVTRSDLIKALALVRV